MTDYEIYVIDDFLPPAEAEEFNRKFFEDSTWSSSWNRGLDPKQEQKWNWHRSVGNDAQNMYETDSMLESLPLEIKRLWDFADRAIMDNFGVKHNMARYYSNSHTYGLDGSMHDDDGSVTALYYPCKDWDINWDGGTAFYNFERDDIIKYASYKYNRMVLFNAKIPHKAMPVSRECYELRTSVVFKTEKDITHPSYVEWYNNRK
jgi:SM-20-related protein